MERKEVIDTRERVAKSNKGVILREVLQMKKIILTIIMLPLMIIIVIVEWLLKLSVKISAVVAGLFFNVLFICMIIAICTSQWSSLGILAIVAVAGLMLVYGNATLLYLFSEARAYVNELRG